MTSRLSRRQLFTLETVRLKADTTPEGRSSDWMRIHRTAMACRFEVVMSSERVRHLPAARLALDEADRIEAALTVFRDSSELMRVNRLAAAEPVAVDAEIFGLLQTCHRLSRETDGAFDVASTPLSRAWGFLRRQGRLPAPDEVAAARAIAGASLVELNEENRTVRFARDGVELNLGSIGKGYALGRMAHVLTAAGVSDALISAGGSSVLALGGDASGWTIDVKSRQIGRDRLARLRLMGDRPDDAGHHNRNGRHVALATSGAGEQFVEIDGVRYGHVIDPRTGWPARGVLSVSVVADDPAVADALSTAFLVGGLPLAEQYCASHPETLVLLTPDDGSERPRVLGSHRGATVEEQTVEAPCI